MNSAVKITITALDGTELYSQTVDSLDLKAVIAAVNTPPPEPPKPKKKRSDAGKPRAPKEVQTPEMPRVRQNRYPAENELANSGQP